jgi:dihydrofolate reductase
MMEGYWTTAADEPDASKHDINHSKWYKQAHKIVLSETMKASDLPNTTIISDKIADKINEIKQQPGSEILLFGSPTATHALIEQNLIDGYWLFVNPVVLGQGIPLFKGGENKTKLKLVSTHQFNSGVTELNYAVEGE